jgi:hypothetical protein
MSGQVHYEVFVRRTPQAPWRLEMATEDRAHALASAEEMMTEGRAAAVRVTKETLDPDSMEFTSVTLLTKGAAEEAKRRPQRDPNADPVCTGPQDLYNSPAREKIQRLLDDWLRRNRATPFELLHRPDLVEKLEASGMELQHAIQKVAVPESQYSGQPVHEIIRAYQRLTEQAIERVIKAGRGQAFPPLDAGNIGAVAKKLAGHNDRLFLLGGSVSAAIADCATWHEKVDRLLDLAEAAPEEPQPRALCQVVIEQPLAEIVGSRAGLADLLGDAQDLGASLAALVRIAAPKEVDALIQVDKTLARLIPELTGPARRLGERLNAGDFKLLGTVLARRVLSELTGPRRLRPSDPKGEIEILRGLAMSLTASAGRLLSLEEVQNAFVERSKAIVQADFVEAYLGQGTSAITEAQLLVKLCENVAGSANKRQAARWLMGCVAALRFEKEFLSAGDSGPQRLAILAELQRTVHRCDLPEKEAREIAARVGEVGGLVEADVKICAQLSRAQAPAVQKLSALLRLASGESAPAGPAAERAKAEVMKLMRVPEVRNELLGSPEAATKMRPLLQMAGLLAA